MPGKAYNGTAHIILKLVLLENISRKDYLERQWMALLDYNYKAMKDANLKRQMLYYKYITQYL